MVCSYDINGSNIQKHGGTSPKDTLFDFQLWSKSYSYCLNIPISKCPMPPPVSHGGGTTVRANVHPVLITIDEMVELGFGKSNSTSCH